MGLGLAGITLVFLALPGVVLAIFLRLKREERPPSIFLDAEWKVIAVAFTSSFFIHFVAVWLSKFASNLLGTATADFSVAGILAGIDKPSMQLAALQNAQEHFGSIISYLFATILLAAVLAWAFRYFLPSSRNWLEQKLDDLQARDRNPVIWLTTATDFDGETWLFEGVYERHLNDKNGEPQFLFLRFAKRRRVVDDGQEERWAQIPGEAFVLRFDRWHSVNLDAFYYDPDNAMLKAGDSESD